LPTRSRASSAQRRRETTATWTSRACTTARTSRASACCSPAPTAASASPWPRRSQRRAPTHVENKADMPKRPIDHACRSSGQPGALKEPPGAPARRGLSHLVFHTGADLVSLVRSSSADLDALGGQVIAGVDVLSEESVNKAMESLATPVDIVINNAGLFSAGARRRSACPPPPPQTHRPPSHPPPPPPPPRDTHASPLSLRLQTRRSRRSTSLSSSR